MNRYEAKVDTIVAYNEESKETYGNKCKTKSFHQAMWEIENDPELKNLSLNTNEDMRESGNEDPEASDVSVSEGDDELEDSAKPKSKPPKKVSNWQADHHDDRLTPTTSFRSQGVQIKGRGQDQEQAEEERQGQV